MPTQNNNHLWDINLKLITLYWYSKIFMDSNLPQSYL